ncbi:uncharacterized protein LOC133649147 isoform X2 [Entelurus aequoreus]|uniref:uncharacterized protein LOC133649147 isoform X2 n=1 Tax=Entelurus aequoreus TaxID=161455 RepID=UPI002B1DD6D9|nr:uncharacterized protein LOC133649147 isoform X2 [Entelurus aequoreus]
MDDRTSTPTTTTEVTRGQQNADLKVSPSSKPLHRFLQKEPQSLGVVIGICGCAELIMGCIFFGETVTNSGDVYVPFWQGALFLTCGILSVYTGACPSKKMVTICLSIGPTVGLQRSDATFGHGMHFVHVLCVRGGASHLLVSGGPPGSQIHKHSGHFPADINATE